MKNTSSILSFMFAFLYFTSTVLAAAIPDVSSLSEEVKSWPTADPCEVLPNLKGCNATSTITFNVTASGDNNSFGTSGNLKNIQVRDLCKQIPNCCEFLFGYHCSTHDESSKREELGLWIPDDPTMPDRPFEEPKVPGVRPCDFLPGVKCNETKTGDVESNFGPIPVFGQPKLPGWGDDADVKSSRNNSEDGFDAWIRLKDTYLWFPFSTRDGKVKWNGKVFDLQDVFNVGDVHFGDVEFDRLFDITIINEGNSS